MIMYKIVFLFSYGITPGVAHVDRVGGEKG